MKKFISLFLVLTLSLTLALAVGCKDKEEDAEVLQFWAYQPTTQEYQNMYNDMLARFTAETGIKVKPNFITKDEYNFAFSTSLRSKNKPSVAYLDQPLIAKYAEEKILYDMTETISSSTYLSSLEFFEGAKNTTVYKGKTYALPLTITTSVLFYNKDLIVSPITTWEQWLAEGNKLNKAQYGLFEGVGNGGYASWYYQVFLENAGGSFLNADETAVTFNNEYGVKAAEMIKKLYDETPDAIRSSSNAFGQGYIATKLGSSSDIDTLSVSFPNLNFGAMKVPTSVGTSYSNIGGENLVVMDYVENKENAMKLVEFLMREENQAKISMISGNFSTVKKYAAVAESDPNYEMKLVVLEQLNTACARPAQPEWLSVNDVYLATAMESILASSTAYSEIQSILDTAAAQATNLLFKK